MRKVTVPEPELPLGPREKKPVKLLVDRTREPSAKGPGPSKLAYRLSRLWKKTWLRRGVLIGGPVAVLALTGWALSQSADVRAFVTAQKDAVMAALSSRPEFAVTDLRVAGASPDLTREIETVAALPEGASSLDLDVAGLQARLTALPAVRAAKVALRADGVLDIRIDERIAEVLWRDGEGGLWLADRDGVAIAGAEHRALHPRLPVVIGDDAPAAIGEALEVFRAVPDLQGRIRALVRVGARRWDVVLDRGLTIMLPEDAPDAALARVMAWHYGEDLLDRGIAVVDMRQADRPTIRMTAEADELYRLHEAARGSEGEDT